MPVFEIIRTTVQHERFTVQASDCAEALKRFEGGEAANRHVNRKETELVAFERPAARIAGGANANR
ncbi:MAG: hypothetical protein WA975_18125 [Mesorhizobium sp.]